ncbi:MAG: glycosyltransferase family 4 protein [Planctomycetota bacterium]
MKICLTANTAWNLAHFRRNHIQALLDVGAEVHAVAPHDSYVDNLLSMGVQFHPWKIERRSLNPSTEMVSVRRIQKIYQKIQPDLVHHYTVKAVLYGTTAARWAGIGGVVNSVTGLPYIVVSQKKGMAKRLARWVAMKWYAWCVTGKKTRVIVQNLDDLAVLESFAKGVRQYATVTNGSGVALDYFQKAPFAGNEIPSVLFVGRFLREKGVFELMDAVRKLKQQGLQFKLTMCGDIDHGNLSSATADECKLWMREGLVDFMGRVDDVRPKLAEADLVVLPSYREGTPRSLLEAMATGRPIVTTDVPGCRNVVEHQVNGLMVPSRSSDALADAMSTMIQDANLRRQMGEAGRLKAVAEFDEKIVIDQTLSVYHELRPDVFPPAKEWSDQQESLSSALEAVAAST